MSETTIYVVPLSQWATGDWSGVSVTADRIWFSHVSSDLYWLAKDTTLGFKKRREELEEAYPDGLNVVLVHPGADGLPDEIAHHFVRNPA